MWKTQAAAERLGDLADTMTEDLTPELVADIKAFWADPGIQEAYSHSSEFQLGDSAAYYFEVIDRLV